MAKSCLHYELLSIPGTIAYLCHPNECNQYAVNKFLKDTNAIAVCTIDDTLTKAKYSTPSKAYSAEKIFQDSIKNIMHEHKSRTIVWGLASAFTVMGMLLK